MNFQKRILAAAIAALPVSFGAFADDTSDREVDNEVVITGSRIETPLRQVGTSISVLDAQDIRDRGHATLVDVLRTLPGISATSNGGLGKATSLRIRGEAGYRTVVLIDGVDVSDPTGTQVGPQIQHILAADIQRVEVLRGPQGTIYGADAGGVINVITRRGEQGISANANVEYGRFGTQRANAGVHGKTGSFDYSLSVADVQSDGFSARDTSIDAAQETDGYDNTTINLQLGAQLNEEWRVELATRDVSSEAGFDGFSSASNHDNIANTDQSNYKLTAKYSGQFGSHQLSYGATDVERENFTGGVSSFATDGTIDQFQYLGTVNVNDTGTLVFGSDWEEEDITSSGGQQLDRTQLGVYAEWQGSVGEQFFYTAGVRSDDNDDFGRNTSIRLTSAYLIPLSEGELKLKASYGNGFRAPALSEIAYNNGPFAFGEAAATELRQEESEGFEVGAEYRATNGLYAELVYFDQDITDEIFFDLVNFSGYLQDTGLTRSKGIELSSLYPLTDTFSATGSYTYTDSINADGNQRRRVPTHSYNLGITGQWLEQALRVSANIRWVRDVEDGAVQLEDYQVLDFTANYQVSDKLSFYVRAENALDETYQEIATYNASGAAYYGGVRFNF
ncbi:TonB-dependent receptor [Porticoccus sp. W117]|uniref:TonB-dependent receptor plug domain-containing protein n=1 Tax=Porticoccus sp. W117 TaxID=3054777 RepID=UPI00259912E5|nr:TonB-dependent receptor [Porticoccus sp. W117]MDM3871422.1 TonB-dependent receptor [Porticoccus sp. W117]